MASRRSCVQVDYLHGIRAICVYIGPFAATAPSAYIGVPPPNSFGGGTLDFLFLAGLVPQRAKRTL